jgi:Family of unknown function (DUF6314)
MRTVDTFRFLLGHWTLERILTDHRSGTDGQFEGNVTIAGTPTGPRAHYDEEGTLRFGNYEGAAARSLELIRLDSSAVMLHFTDGKPFVDLDLRSGTWRSTHPCGEDHYELFTTVRAADEVEERWRVRGPTTDYDAVATLRRLD